ncbi:hypothetical protein, partial [uncultured Akkermansia sp.]
TIVTLREYITLTATLDGKELPEGTRCDWSAVEGGEYFKLEHSNEEFGTVTVNINTLAKARQTLKVKAEVDGVEQVVEFTLIPPQGLIYAGAESPFRQAEEEAAKVGCTVGLSALRILRVYPLNVSFTNLYSLEQHAGYKTDWELVEFLERTGGMRKRVQFLYSPGMLREHRKLGKED